jgi:hypothetical protein
MFSTTARACAAGAAAEGRGYRQPAHGDPRRAREGGDGREVPLSPTLLTALREYYQ